ncbi:MAG: putative Trk system potassium uptake protein [Candidatus Hecatellales archaeon B24]|nr:MAG: putative Trk system potassium uptake protein [Candidatus Hecatellales archaeon B24]
MYAVIVGLSGVGQSLAKTLIERGYDVAIIDKNHERCEKFSSEYDALVICGDAVEKDTLRDAGIEKADALVAATGDDSVNLMIVSMAKEFGARNVVAVVRNPEHIGLFKKSGVRVIVPDEVVAEHLYQHLYRVKDFLVLGENQAEIFVVRVENGSGKPLKKIGIPNGSSIIGIYRDGKLNITLPSDMILRSGDELLVYTIKPKPESIRKVVEAFAGKI